MKPYYQDSQATLYHGDALGVLRSLPDESVNCVVTSPPYFGLRDYGVDGQLGMEESPAEYVAALVAVMAEAKRVLAKDGTCWLNLGDSYYSGRGNPGPNADDGKNVSRRGWVRAVDRPGQEWGRQKSLIGIPHRVVFALQDDGWIWRNTVVWAKPNGMPESVQDRLSVKHEYIFMLTKSKRYWFDLDPIREPLLYPEAADGSRVLGGKGKGGRNPGDVWTIPTQPFSEAHFAVFPVEIPRRCIAAGCPRGGVVLDPFNGSGTTGQAASELGARYVGIDINRDYLDLSMRTRLRQPSLTSEASGWINPTSRLTKPLEPVLDFDGGAV